MYNFNVCRLGTLIIIDYIYNIKVMIKEKKKQNNRTFFSKQFFLINDYFC